MSTTAYEALRAAPALGQQRQQFAALLAARAAARRTLDLVLGAPRGAWTLLRRTTAGWLSRILPTSADAALRRMLAPVARLRSLTAVVGLVPFMGVALTTLPVQGIVSRALGGFGRLAVKAAVRSGGPPTPVFGSSVRVAPGWPTGWRPSAGESPDERRRSPPTRGPGSWSTRAGPHCRWLARSAVAWSSTDCSVA